MEKWMMYAKRADFAALADKFQIDQVLARIMVNRDVVSEQDIYRFLHPSLADLGDERQLKGMERAVSLLHQAIVEGKKIRIIGDYDADGIQSTYILKTALKRCGADVDYAIPDRVEDGYGINASMVRAACDAGMEVILTCDNGIAAVNEIALAVNLGMTVIVTDHHEIPFSMVEGQKKYHLPLAQAIVNPKQPGCGYPFKNICGATVAWKLVLALYETFGIPAGGGLCFSGKCSVCHSDRRHGTERGKSQYCGVGAEGAGKHKKYRDGCVDQPLRSCGQTAERLSYRFCLGTMPERNGKIRFCHKGNRASGGRRCSTGCSLCAGAADTE